MMQTVFVYRADLLAQFPAVVGGVLWATALRNGPTSAALQQELTAEQAAVKARLLPPSETPSLAAWRSAFRNFGVNPTQYRSAAEALLRRLDKKGDVPSINTLVDLANLVSIRYALPVAVFDTRDIALPLTVHPASGDERFVELDRETVAHPAPGEVIFSDTTGQVAARRWCWRQSAESSARADTTTALVTVEAHHEGAGDDIAAAVADLSDLLQRHAGATLTSTVLDHNRPVFAV